jgi:hypothetical protein
MPAVATRAELTVLPGAYSVCRLPADADVPAWVMEGDISSVTRTADELSIVCRDDAVPEQVQNHPGWRVLRVEGPLDLTKTGIVSSLTVPLAAAGVAVFVLSTFDTDYLLVPGPKLAAAEVALAIAGHGVDMAAA